MSNDADNVNTETEIEKKLPQKRFYRQRAHANPMADHSFTYPVHPGQMNWFQYFPDIEDKQVEFVDIGCGYGGFLVTLSTLYPEIYTVGFEIRVKVSDYVVDRIEALRQTSPNQYRNIACIRSNAMKYLPNYFYKGQLTKMFFLYPDPHFKKSKYKRRIINRALLAEYAYVLREGGKIYTITDVHDLHTWMLFHLTNNKLFVTASEIEMKEDPIIEKLYESSEEGIKVTRNRGNKYIGVFKRI